MFFCRCKFSKLTVSAYKAQQGMRIDRFLVNELNQNWNEVQKFIRNGEITINQKKVKDHQFILQEGDQISFWEKLKNISLQQNERTIPSIQAYEELQKMILFENDEVLVLNKKHGYASQGGAIPDYNIPEILNLYSKNFYIIHRLDQLTSGLLIIAKNKEIAVSLSRIIQEKINIQKKYYAIVQGDIKDKSGLIDTPLWFNTNNQKQQIKDSNNNLQIKYLNARTEFKKLQTLKYKDEIFTSLEITIYEGRKHQIRAHLSQVLQTPIIFDQKYGFKFTQTNRELQENIFGKQQGIMLMAKQLTFRILPFNVYEKFISNNNGTILQKEGKLIIEANYSKEFDKFLQFFVQ